MTSSSKKYAPYIWIMVILVMFFSAIPGLAADPSKPVISEPEFARLLDQKLGITNFIIPSHLLVNALRQKKSISLIDCVVDGDIILEQATVQSCEFKNVVFNGKVSIKNTEFVGPLLLTEGTNFKAEVEFQSVKFKDLVSCNGRVVFDKWFSSYQCNFLDQVLFDQATFNGGVSFNESTFKLAYFIATNFGDKHSFFESTIFHDVADFNDTRFGGEVSFAKAVFEQQADFRGSRMKRAVDFGEAQFKGDVYFSQVEIADRASFQRSVFFKDTYLNKINNITTISSIDSGTIQLKTERKRQGQLLFYGVSFQGRVHLIESHLDVLDFSERGPVSNKSDYKLPPTIFEKRVIARDLNIRIANFTDVEFRDVADFSGSTFTQLLSLSSTTFNGEADFFQCKFPGRSSQLSEEASGTYLARVRFEKAPQLDYSQLIEERPWWQIWKLTPDSKVVTGTASTWQSLEKAFMKSGNLDSQNEAMYHRRTLAAYSVGEDKENIIINRFSSVFWGYGVRPWRLAAWIVFFYILFTFIYWTQTKELGNPAKRMKFSLDFARRTSLTLGYGYQNARTPFFKALTLIHSIAFKIMLICLLKAISNVSPLLKDLMGKLLPL